MSTQLDIVVRKEGNTFFLYDRTWHHLVEDEDLNRAYEQIINQQRLLRERCRRAGVGSVQGEMAFPRWPDEPERCRSAGGAPR